MKKQLLHKELSYKVIGTLFDVYNTLGPGYQEKYYQKAISVSLKKNCLKFKEQVHVPLEYNQIKIGNYFIDFIIEDLIALEIKAKAYFHQRDIKQVLAYLNAHELELGLLANFTTSGLVFKRILKGYSGRFGK